MIQSMYQSTPPQAHLHTDIQRRDTPRSWTCPTKSAGFYISNHLSNLGSDISEFATRCDDNLVAWPGCGRIWSVRVTYPVGSPFGVNSVGETCEKRGIKVGLSKNCFVCHLHLANWTSRTASPLLNMCGHSVYSLHTYPIWLYSWWVFYIVLQCFTFFLTFGNYLTCPFLPAHAPQWSCCFFQRRLSPHLVFDGSKRYNMMVLDCFTLTCITHRIHGAGIYANMTGVYWW